MLMVVVTVVERRKGSENMLTLHGHGLVTRSWASFLQSIYSEPEDRSFRRSMDSCGDLSVEFRTFDQVVMLKYLFYQVSSEKGPV